MGPQLATISYARQDRRGQYCAVLCAKDYARRCSPHVEVQGGADLLHWGAAKGETMPIGGCGLDPVKAAALQWTGVNELCEEVFGKRSELLKSGAQGYRSEIAVVTRLSVREIDEVGHPVPLLKQANMSLAPTLGREGDGGLCTASLRGAEGGAGSRHRGENDINEQGAGAVNVVVIFCLDWSASMKSNDTRTQYNRFQTCVQCQPQSVARGSSLDILLPNAHNLAGTPCAVEPAMKFETKGVLHVDVRDGTAAPGCLESKAASNRRSLGFFCCSFCSWLQEGHEKTRNGPPPRISIGSHDDAHVKVEDERVASRHCVVFKEGRHWFVEGVSTQRPMRLGDVQLEPGVAYQLRSGDVFSLDALGSALQYLVEFDDADNWYLDVVSDKDFPNRWPAKMPGHPTEAPEAPEELKRLAWQTDQMRRRSEEDQVLVADWAAFSQYVKKHYHKYGIFAEPWQGSLGPAPPRPPKPAPRPWPKWVAELVAEEQMLPYVDRLGIRDT
ncbi:unnamed protein product [Symbiodinium natans]|uniref:FHA domain-containing protein n=1 Tax=Symbiodinium natans TaxID=878477 RepID=A0A812TVV0_9DINO|nr:unnamed protein product [Symbiodinium natans]